MSATNTTSQTQDPRRIAWLRAFAGAAPSGGAQKDAAVRRAAEAVEWLAPRVQATLGEVRVHADHARSKGKLLHSTGADPNQTRDVTELQATDSLLRDDGLPADLAMLNTAWLAIDDVVKDLQRVGLSDGDIASEVYEPLVRRGVLPETLVPGRFSRNQQSIDQSNSLYRASLDGAAPEPHFELAKALIDAGAGITSAVLGPIASDAAKGSALAMAPDIVDGCSTLMQGGVDATSELRRGQSAKAAVSVLESLPDLIGTLARLHGDASANTAGASAELAAAITKLGERLASGDAGAAEFADVLNSVIQTTISAARQGGAGDSKTASAKIDVAADAAGAALDLARSEEAHEVWNRLAAHDMQGATTALLGVLTASGITDATALAGDIKTLRSGTGNDIRSIGADLAKPIDDVRVQVVATWFTKQEQVVGDAARGDAAKARDKAEQEGEQSRLAFTHALQEAAGGSPDETTIEKLTERMERDRKILSVATAIGQGGLQVAASFFAPMAIGVAAFKMVADMRTALQDWQDLSRLAAREDEARGARAAVANSVAALASSARMQFGSDALALAIDGLRMAEAAVSTAHGVPVTLQATSAAGAGIQAIFKFYKHQRLQKAWRITKEALADPANRRLAELARTKNPELAKYAIAYAAMELGDPMALEILKTCGLTDAALQERSANVQAVKQYLDGALAFAEGVPGGDPSAAWTSKLPKPTLTVGAVLATYKIARDGIATDLARQMLVVPRALEGRLTIVSEPLSADATTEAVAEAVTQYERLAGEFRREASRLVRLDATLKARLEVFATLAEEATDDLRERIEGSGDAVGISR
jgi:hypothetical protein